MRDQEFIGLQEAYQQVHAQPPEEVEQLDERRYDRDEPLPGSGKTPRQKMQRKRDQHAARVSLGNPALGRNPRNDPERDSYRSRASMMDRVKDSQDKVEEPRDDEGRKNLIKAARRPRASYERQDNRPGGLRAGETRAAETDDQGRVRSHRAVRRVKPEETKESFDLFDYLLEYLVAEGYADTNEAALAIMANMSEEWKHSIVEGDALQNTIKTLEGKRDAMNANKPGSANTAAPGKQSVGAATYKAYQRLRGV